MASPKVQEIEGWFCKEVIKWRSGASIAWSALITIPVTVLFLFAVEADFWHPITWLLKTAWRIISFSEWQNMTALAVFMMLVAWYNSRYYKMRPDILGSRIDNLWNTVRPQRMTQIIFHIFIGLVVTKFLMGMTNTRFGQLANKCENSESDAEIYCLNEGNLFIIIFGAVIGGTFALQVYLNQQNYIVFPIVQQDKFFQVKGGLFPLLMNSLGTAFWCLKYYVIFYYLVLGAVSKRSVKRNMALIDGPEFPVNTLRGMMDIGLLWTTFMSGAFLHFIFSIPILLYRIYQTEPYEFPVETQYANLKNKCLYNALSSSNSLIQYYGFQDLSLLSKYSHNRRKEIFSLTQLGGHPQNWNSIASECITQLKAFTVELAHFNAKTMIEGPIRQLSGDKTKQSAMPSDDKVGSFGNVDNLTFRGRPVPRTSEAQSVIKQPSFSSKILQQLKQRKALVFLLSELPDKESQKLFAESQRFIWAVQALSNLVIASFKEDTFGVVQKSLPTILSTLLALHEAVEKHFKLGTSINRKPTKSLDGCDSNDLRFTLKSELKSALYEIVITFGDHVNSIPLEIEEKKKLQMFVEFKE